MRLKESRIGSFLVILVVYVMAMALGLYIYRTADGYHWFRILVADVIVTVFVFLFISIPRADKRQSAKPGYDEYREGKNMLLPFRFR